MQRSKELEQCSLPPLLPSLSILPSSCLPLSFSLSFPLPSLHLSHLLSLLSPSLHLDFSVKSVFEKDLRGLESSAWTSKRPCWTETAERWRIGQMHGSPVCVCNMCLEGGGKEKERNMCTACFDVCNIESSSGHTLFLLSREMRR
jgi:hypothetical protein